MSRRERREREEQEEKERKKQEKLDKKRKKKEDKNKKTKNDNKKDNKKGNDKDTSKEKRKKKKDGIFKKIVKTILKILLVIILLIIILIGSFVAYLGFTYDWNWNKMLRKGARQVALIATGQTEADIDNLDPLYCLILGISTDEEGSLLTDTMIVAAYYPRTQQASMLSIPRDTFVGKSKATALSGDKINAVYSARGINGLMTEVEKITGLDINNYVIVKNAGLIEVVDEIGGVDFYVPCDMDYDDWKQKLHIHLKEGQQRLNGEQAEGLVRFRKNNDGTGYPYEYGNDDFGRMRTQKEFITETIRQTLKVSNIGKINELIEIAFRNIETNLDMNYVMKYSPAAVEFDVSAIQTASLEGTTPQYGPYQLYFFEPYKEKTKKIIEDLFIFNQRQYDAGVSEVTVKPENIKIQLLNASGEETILEDTKKRLETKGYNVEETGTTTIAKTTKVINRTEKKAAIVDELVDTLGYGDETIGQDSSKYDFTIVIGQDMKEYVTQPIEQAKQN